jgi:hypothetical protein
MREDYYIEVNRSESKNPLSEPAENINVNQLEHHPGDAESKRPPMWINEYFQNRVWVDDDTKFGIDMCARITIGVINRNYRKASDAQSFKIRVYNQGIGDFTTIWGYIGVVFLCAFIVKTIIDVAVPECFRERNE